MSAGASSHVENGENGENNISSVVLPVDADGKALPFHAGRPVVGLEDEKRMKRLSWKLDLWILPLLTLVMLLASMDRSDVGILLHNSPLVIYALCPNIVADNANRV